MIRPLIALRSFLLILLLAGPLLAISPEQEIQLGAQAAAQFEQQYGLSNDAVFNERLNRVGQKLIAHAKRQDLPWRFRVIRVNEFNAAAFPGGFVYATEGLMRALDDNELAFVIGHEIAHADLSHSVKQLQSAQLRRLGLIAIAAGATGGDINQGAAALVNATDTVIGSQYSQGAESEADRYGMTVMAAGGYDPAYALSALQKMAAQSSGGTPGFLNTLIGSHPLTKNRINAGADLITSIPFQTQRMAPVGSVNQPARPAPSPDSRLYVDATEALEYSLSLLGNNHRDSLQTLAEQVSLGSKKAPAGVKVVRVKQPASGGLSALEKTLLARPEFQRTGQAFGAAVVDAGSGQAEAVVLLQGGR